MAEYLASCFEWQRAQPTCLQLEEAARRAKAESEQERAREVDDIDTKMDSDENDSDSDDAEYEEIPEVQSDPIRDYPEWLQFENNDPVPFQPVFELLRFVNEAQSGQAITKNDLIAKINKMPSSTELEEKMPVYKGPDGDAVIGLPELACFTQMLLYHLNGHITFSKSMIRKLAAELKLD
jgi:hypothetical protein